ncbi:hypothetical protein D3C71_1508450 [compost metagenome]
MGAIEDHVDPVLTGTGGNRLDRHHQTGAVGDVGQGHEFDSWVLLECRAIARHQAFEAGRVGVLDFDHLDPTIPCQPAHRTFDRVVFQIADQYLVTRLQAVVVANQRLQRVRGIAGEGHGLRGDSQQVRQLPANLHAFEFFEALTHVHRVAAVDQFDVALVFLDDRARHAAEVTVFQVDGARLDIVAIGKGPPEGFIMGAEGVIGHGENSVWIRWFSGEAWVCRAWRAAGRAGRTNRCDRFPASGPAGHPVHRGGSPDGRTSSGKGRAGRQ